MEGHVIVFEDFSSFDLTNKSTITDFINLFFRWNDSKFIITHDRKHPKRRGSHIFIPITKLHEISLSKKNIEKDFNKNTRLGGNICAPTLEVGAIMVLTHEIQHANQTMFHHHQKSFYKGKYDKKSCEVDARRFVDENFDIILEYFGLSKSTNELKEIADCLNLSDEISVEDIKLELKLSGLLNEQNIKIVQNFLKKE
jgi:hypothetical protein